MFAFVGFWSDLYNHIVRWSVSAVFHHDIAMEHGPNIRLDCRSYQGWEEARAIRFVAFSRTTVTRTNAIVAKAVSKPEATCESPRNISDVNDSKGFILGASYAVCDCVMWSLRMVSDSDSLCLLNRDTWHRLCRRQAVVHRGRLCDSKHSFVPRQTYGTRSA